MLVVQTHKLRRPKSARDFVANVSHELRTPLAALKAMAETLEAGAIDDTTAARDFTRRMIGEIDRLTELVEELLLISRLESGQPVIAPGIVSPVVLLDEAKGRLSALVQRAGLRLVVDAGEPAASVAADRERVATGVREPRCTTPRSTPRGRRDPDLRDAKRGTAWRSRVRDTGRGIAESDLEHLRAVLQSDRSRSDGGRALACRSASTCRGTRGTIHAASAGAGGGTTFTFTLRLSSRDDRILVVDDETNCDTPFRTRCGGRGTRSRARRTERRDSSCFVRAARSRRPGCDAPGMDGLAVCRAIVGEERRRGSC